MTQKWTIHPAIAITSLVVVLATGTISGFLIGQHHPRIPPVSTQGIPVKCLGVLDGDTIRVEWNGQEQHVRMIGIECLETRNGKKLEEQVKKYGLPEWMAVSIAKQAKARTTAATSDRYVELVFPGQKETRDAFGRLLSYVHDSGRDIGLNLLESGLAAEYPAAHERQAQYRDAVETAKRGQRGIWQVSGSR